MRLQTNNKLAHYQCEYQELCEQTAMLQNQVPALQAQIAQLQAYCNVNCGDRAAIGNLKKLLTRMRTLSNNIARNQQRLNTLARQIQNEQARIQARMCGQTRGYRPY